jgi:hypothetical protein
MPRLSELQRGFADAVRFAPASVEALDVQSTSLAPARRVAIYRNHHRISLVDALGANFATVRSVIGDQAFQALAADFIAIEPPTEPRLSQYGAGFADFLVRDRRVQDLPYLADVARLDWACNVAERAEDLPIFGPSHLEAAQADLAGLTLTPHPSLSLIRSAYPLLRIRDLAQAQPEAGQGVSLAEGGVNLMVWRRDATTACEALDADAYRFMEKVAAGATLGVAAADLAPDRLSYVLARCLLTGAFTAQSF